MGTRSKTTIFDEQNKPLLSFYRQYDGYYEGHGAELQEFLANMAIVNGYGVHTPAKAANGMGCLAAQVIAHFKKSIGGFYIVSHDNNQEFNYEIRFVNVVGHVIGAEGANRVSLVGESEYADEKTKRFPLYADEVPKILRKVTFVYDKRDGAQAKWRNVDVISENDTHLEGMENGKVFKRFLKSKILGGKILPA